MKPKFVTTAINIAQFRSNRQIIMTRDVDNRYATVLKVIQNSGFSTQIVNIYPPAAQPFQVTVIRCKAYGRISKNSQFIQKVNLV